MYQIYKEKLLLNFSIGIFLFLVKTFLEIHFFYYKKISCCFVTPIYSMSNLNLYAILQGKFSFAIIYVTCYKEETF